MPLQVGELFVKLNLDNSNFNKLLSSAQKQLQDIAKKDLKLKADISVGGLSAAKSSITGIISSLTQTQRAAQNTGRSFFDLGEIIRGALSYTVGIGITNTIRDLASAIGSVIPQAADFQAQMSGVQAVLMPTGEELENLRNKAIQLGKDTKYSASEAAQGIEMLAKNGLNATQILNGAADATVNLAAAAGTDLATAADISTDVIQQFGLKATDMNNAINMITGSVNASKFDINDYKLAIGQAGGVAGAVGVTFADFNTFLAATSAQFRGGSDAGTSFKTFLQRLTPVSNEAKDAMESLGIITADGTNQFFNAQGELRPMVEIMELLREKMGNLSAEDFGSKAHDIFGTDAIRVVTGLLGTNVEQWNALQAAIEGTSAADQARIRMDNLQGVMEILRSSFETLSIRIGESFLPQLMEIGRGAIDIVNVLTTLVEALNGSQESFNQLDPALQAVVVGIQTAMDYFTGIANLAMEWGSNIGSSFASGIIDAASAVIDALMEMGSWIEYWLAPGSPPRVAPDLDQWGKSVAQVYFDSFGNAQFHPDEMKRQIQRGLVFKEEDFKSIKDISGTIEDVLSSMVPDDNAGKASVIETVIGSREVIKKAIAELRNTGDVSENTFNQIIDSAGEAGQEVKRLVALYIEQTKAADELERAQNALTKAQNALNAAESAKDAATAPIKAKLEQIKAAQKLIDIESDITEQRKLANAFGGDGTVQAKARAKLEELALEKELILQEQKYDAQINAAKQEVEAAKNNVDIAKEKENAVKAQIDLEKARLDSLAEQNNLIREQMDLMKKLIESESKKSSAGGAKKTGKTDAEKAAEAQEKYNLSIADTEGKLAILRAKLSTVEEGSAEYYDILGDIKKLEDTQAKERDKAAKDEQKAKDEQVKAQRDYEYSIADTNGKLAILRKELEGATVGSEDYYDILKKIDQVEKQKAKEDEQAQKDAERAGRSGRAPSNASLPPIHAPTGRDRATEGDDPLAKAKKTVQEVSDSVHDAKMRFDEFGENVDTARRKVNEFLAPIKEVATNLQQFLVPALAALSTPAVIGGLVAIGTALAGLFSPITLLSLAVGALVYAWQTNFMDIQGYTSKAWTFLQGIFNGIAEILQTFWTEHGAEFVAKLQEMWGKVQGIISTLGEFILKMLGGTSENLNKFSTNWSDIINGAWIIISNIISGALTVIQGILDVFIGLATGNWEQMWKGLNEITDGLIQAIRGIIEGTLTAIAGLFGANIEDIEQAWNAFWNNLFTWATTTVEDIADRLRTWGTDTDAWANKLIADLTRMWTDFWDNTGKTANKFLIIAKKYITDRLGEAKKFFVDTVDEMKRRYIDSFMTIASETLIYLGRVVTNVTTKLGEAKSEVIRLAGEFVEGWKTKLGEMVAGLTTQIGLIVAKLTSTSTLEEFLDAAAKIGKAIIDGMIAGVVANVADAILAVKDAVGKMITGGEEKAKIKSPSKVFADMGAMMMQGLAVGVQDYSKLAEMATSQAMNNAILSANPSVLPQTAATMATGSITNYYFDIDARGSNLSEDQFRRIVRDEVNGMSRSGSNRRRN